ncbi:DUF2066 domain-containing protein [Anaerobiospirillum sp. NML120448]|uniref:DUF2066 domain-containing protein n=1 Tax=Anaerobiospirillum sp. NML120448 TaxID=2932816 RepID=UPI001FF1FD82|nr:DUF2066 domain-containing protein [Anaerobiospirillum sp. NML120448]MCK0513672.1 DUF2066 domain-containing protein [Anaerobiospirillum sp. NML120448]
MLNYKLTLLASSLTLVLGSCAAASAQPTNYQITSDNLINQEQANYTIEMAQQPQKAQPQSATQAPAPAQAQPQAQAQPAQTAKAAQAPVMEQIAQPSQAELNNRSYVKDQLYPATNDSYGRGAFTPVNSNEQMNNSQPGFTFENQSAPNANAANANNLGPENAETLGVLNGGYATERIQEVSVPILTTFDNAVLDGFKSLESGITLGMGQISNLTIDEIAPALRSFTSDADGNLVLRFSLPMAEAILKKQGAASWQGLSNPVLVWMVGLDGQSNGTNMSVVSGQNLSSFAQAIMAATPDYKYRLMFPIFDLEEMNKVKVTTILDHEDEVLTKASERYGADFFISAAISSVPNESGMTFKWNLFNRYGENIAQSSISGLMDEVASLGAGDIARALMTYQSNLEEKETPSALRQNNVDIDMLGPGEGFVRLRIANVKSLQDLQHIRQAFVTYGFDGDIRIVGYDNNMLVMEVATNSSADNLSGTMRHSGEFQYISPWIFSFTGNEYIRPPHMSNLGPANKARPNSQINPDNVTPAYSINIKDARDVGQGEGLPNRNAPAIQGRTL